MRFEKRGQQGFAAREVAIERPRANACALGDAVHRNIDAFLGKRVAGDLENVGLVTLGVGSGRAWLNVGRHGQWVCCLISGVYLHIVLVANGGALLLGYCESPGFGN
ncbi:hypothetical protein VDG04_12350 [Xanthomonas campestris pv. raphani]|nr:hypothetical protein [Xanthomonas campestris pv. raphani]